MAYLFTEMFIIGWHTQRYKRGFVIKTRAIKLQFLEKHVKGNSLLTPAYSRKRQ